MTKETSAHKKQRLHYQKLYEDAMNAPVHDIKKQSDSLRDYNCFRWNHIDHVCSAMGGFANFRHWIITAAENEFSLTKELSTQLLSARKLIENVASSCNYNEGENPASEWLDENSEEDVIFLENIPRKKEPSLSNKNKERVLKNALSEAVRYKEDLDKALELLIMQMGKNNAVKMLSEDDAKKLIHKYKPEVFKDDN